MASTYTVNIGIEKPGTGDQSGTWGVTTNTNFDIIDQATNGIATVTLAAAGTSGSPNTLLINNGALSDGRNRFIEFNDGADLGATAYVQLDPMTLKRLCTSATACPLHAALFFSKAHITLPMILRFRTALTF